MKLVFTPEAERQANEMDAWWREHRPDARHLFARELAARRSAEIDAGIVSAHVSGASTLDTLGRSQRGAPPEGGSFLCRAPPFP